MVTGIGVLSAIGQGKSAFLEALLEGRTAFGVMRRPGRQKNSAYLGAEMEAVEGLEGIVPEKILRQASLPSQAALAVLAECWAEARLSEVDGRRIGMVIGGSNLQQRDAARMHENLRDKASFVRPTYALSFLDTDLCGFCTSHFQIAGPAITVGGASASGQVAILQAAQAVQSGGVDVCIAMGALMDLSYWECQALRSIGAMGSDRYPDEPRQACRPFDRNHDGFIYGEACGAVVIESAASSEGRGMVPYAALCGGAMVMDGNRNPNPSLDGEQRAIETALVAAGWSADEVQYVNPHGTGSALGDETELQALRMCNLQHASINTTKSLVGHGLSAAGAIEVAATLLQMRAGRLHPSRNLEEPVDSGFSWVRDQSKEQTVDKALTLSMGFGGINTALCWQALEHFRVERAVA